jgi:hypothetical protein
MARNGSGVYNLPAGQPVVTGTTISSTTFNTLTSDLATALTNSVAVNGESVITANIPMSSYKITGIGAATARTDAASLANAQDGTGVYVSTVGGTADVITLTPSPAITSYTAGQTFAFIASGTITTNVTVNVSGLGAKDLTRNGTTALVAGDIVSGSLVHIRYDGTRFQTVSAILPGNLPYLNSSNTWSDRQFISYALPQIVFIETDATDDNKRWDIRIDSETFELRAVNDANIDASDFLVATRTGITVDQVTIGGTTVSVSGTLSSTKAAASGFTRMTPNFCMRTDVISTTSLTRDAYASVSIPSGATALLIYVVADAKSNNAVASRYTVVQGQQQTGSLETSPGHSRVLAMAYEHVAVAAATTLTTVDGWIILQASTPYLIMYDDTGNQGTAGYQVRGYWD